MSQQQDSIEKPYPSTASAWYAVFILFVAFTVSSIDRQILSLMVEPVRTDLNLTDFQMSMVQGLAFSLLFSVAGLPISRLADRKSRRAIVSAGITFWCVMTALCGYASTFTQLFLARMGVGVGEATLSPAGTSMIADYFSTKNRGLALSVFYLGYPVGGGLALIIGAAVLDALSGMEVVSIGFLGDFKPWQAAFLIVGLPGLILAVLMFTVREPSRRGVIKAAGEEQAKPLTIKQLGEYLWSYNKAYTVQFSAVLLISILSFGTAMWYPTFLIRTYEVSASDAGYSYGLIVIVFGVLGLLFGGWLSKALLEKGHVDANLRVMLIAVAAKTIPMILATLMPTFTWSLIMLAPATFFSSMAPGVSIAALYEITPNQIRGQVIAIRLFFVNLVGIGFGGMLIAAVTDFVFQDDMALRYSLALVTAIVLPIAALILWRGLPNFRESIIKANNEWAGVK